MIRKTLITIIGVVAMVAMIQTAQASIVSVENNLGALASGGDLAVGDKTFSGFSFIESGLSGFSASGITVTASYDTANPTVYYLTYGGNMQLSGNTSATADLLLGYTVTATAGSISMIDQRYTGGALNGSILINETATSGAPTGHSQLSTVDVSDPNIYPNSPGTYDPITHQYDTGELDLLNIDPSQTTLIVTKDLAFSIFEGGGQVSVSSVQQSYHQVVPEPTTI